MDGSTDGSTVCLHDPPPRPRRILVVEDDTGIRALLETAPRLSGYEVSSVATGRDALLEATRFAPALLVLDVMLSDVDGFELTRSLRTAGVITPVLFVIARTDLDDRLAGLRAGGDDYVGKLFSIDEVLLRIGAVLRRTDPEGEDGRNGAVGEVLRYADLELDEAAHEVSRAGTYIPLSPHRVQAARLPDGQRGPGGHQAHDPGAGMGLPLLG